MRRLLSLILLSSITSAGVFAATGMLDYLSGRTDGETITIEWKSGVESGVKQYVIERSDVKGTEFSAVGTVAATGSHSSYRYRDMRVSGANAAGGANEPMLPLSDLYKYRLKIEYGKEISYSQTISVTRPTSGVRRTWGMIKEMFH